MWGKRVTVATDRDSLSYAFAGVESVSLFDIQSCRIDLRGQIEFMDLFQLRFRIFFVNLIFIKIIWVKVSKDLCYRYLLLHMFYDYDNKLVKLVFNLISFIFYLSSDHFQKIDKYLKIPTNMRYNKFI